LSDLTRALVIAAEAHAGQVDKAGEAYILHLIRVMLRVTGEDERIAALLHDLVEDTTWTLEDLRAEGFSAAVVRAVDHLTCREGEVYHRFVKRADLEENMDHSRIAEPSETDFARLEKYRQVLHIVS